MVELGIFAGVHDVFHVSHLQKCARDPKDVLIPRIMEDLVVKLNMTYVQKPIWIIDQDKEKKSK